MIIKLRAMTKAAKKGGLLVLASEYEGTYATGQHIDSSDKTTRGNLTPDQMMKVKPLTEKQVDDFPFIIDPMNTYKWKDGHKFNTDDYMDRAFMKFILLNSDKVAENKAVYNRGKHEWYFEDKEAEAKIIIDNDDLWFEARQKVANCSIDRMRQISLLLNYLIKNASIDIRNSSSDIIKALLYDLCKKSPKIVLSCFQPGAQDDIFIMELVHHNILSLKEGKFYDGTRFVGGNILDVKEYMNKSDNVQAKSRWLTQLDTAKGRRVTGKDELFEKVINTVKVLIFDKKFEEAEKELDSLEAIYPENERIDGLRKDLKQVVFINTPADASGDSSKELMSEKQKQRYDELQMLEIEDLQGMARDSKRKKADWEGLNKEQLVRYHVSFIK